MQWLLWLTLAKFTEGHDGWQKTAAHSGISSNAVATKISHFECQQ
jgi:hypothetical protein